MSKTIADLQEAFAGESQASKKYQAFAKKAEDEGYPQVARLFRAAAHAETIHAQNHLRAMDGVKSTADNIKVAINGENFEHVSMYPAMVANAEAEGNRKALLSLRWAMEVEKVHERLYTRALECLADKSAAFDYYVCPVCGFTAEGGAPEKCPVCGASAGKFEKID